MTENKKSPDANEAPKKTIKEILIDLANDYFQCWLPALKGDSSKFLGRRLAIAQAEITRIVNDNEILVAANKHLPERVAHLEIGYSQLCDAHDENKRLHHEIGVRQKKHIETCDKNFLNLKGAIEELRGS